MVVVQRARRDSAGSASSGSSDEEDGNTSFKLMAARSVQPPSKRVKVNVADDEMDAHAREKITAERVARAQKDEEDWSFQALGLSPWLVASCHRLGMKEPTEVQRQCVPPTLSGINIIGSAPTGSGKTAAFALPILERLAVDMYGVFAVVVTPTRELAFQISEQFCAFGSPLRLRCEVIVGGVDMITQQTALTKRPHVIVATPGRLAAHIEGPSPPALNRTAFVVLDEADRLLDQSFSKQLGVLFRALPKSRQTLLYSATMTSALDKAKSSSTRKVFEFHATPKATTPDALEERYLLVPEQVKMAYLAYLLRRLGPEVEEGPLSAGAEQSRNRRKLRLERIAKRKKAEEEGYGTDSEDDNDNAKKEIEGGENTEKEEEEVVEYDRAKLVIIFASSRNNCELIGESLKHLGVDCVTLHSNLTQNRRLAALGKFKSRLVKVLVATDVASRGLDIPQVDLVVNYDVPVQVEDYVHRVGRTARAGRKGLAVTLVTQYEIKLVLAIEEMTGVKLELLPGVDEDKEVMVLLTRVANAAKAARLAISTRDADDSAHRRVPNRHKDKKKR
mmetsp:Transcript_2966/g.5686  ORF Transcript_2966/g.5686 Transcript_2966/m.5686 type:complete len:562 (-) Transcript_2966:40-1725(-)